MAELFRRWRAVSLVHEIRKRDQVRCTIVKSDVEVARVHQLVNNAVYCRKELLQIVSAAALFSDPVQRGTERLYTFTIGHIAVSGAKASHLPVLHQRRAGE